MPKVGMEEIRRRQLIDATIAAIHEIGFAEASLSRISAKAGVSTGIVHHYFKDKADLLEATFVVGNELKNLCLYPEIKCRFPACTSFLHVTPMDVGIDKKAHAHLC